MPYLHSAYLPRGKYALKTFFNISVRWGIGNTIYSDFHKQTCPESYTFNSGREKYSQGDLLT